MNKDYNNTNYIGATEIRPNDSHTSFYKKCYDVFDGQYHVCYSYGTPVMVLDTETGIIARTWDDASNTTMRHIRAWMSWLNIGTISKQEYRNMTVEDVPQCWMTHKSFAHRTTHNSLWSPFFDVEY